MAHHTTTAAAAAACGLCPAKRIKTTVKAAAIGPAINATRFMVVMILDHAGKLGRLCVARSYNFV